MPTRTIRGRLVIRIACLDGPGELTAPEWRLSDLVEFHFPVYNYQTKYCDSAFEVVGIIYEQSEGEDGDS